MSKAVLILSTCRTGTVFFARALGDLYPEVAAYHERGSSRLLQILTNACLGGLLPRALLVNAWRAFMEPELRRCEHEFHVDANCFLYGAATLAPDVLPNVRVIHLIRDARTYLSSHWNHVFARPSSFAANYFVPLWQPSPFLTGEISWAKLPGFSRFQRYAWLWDFKNRTIEAVQQAGRAYLQLRFEDLFVSATPEEAFAQMTDFIGLPRRMDIRERFARALNQASRARFPEWIEWAPAQCRQMHELCGARMRRYGYGTEALWQEKLGPRL